MGHWVIHVRVFVSSPRDCAKEREALEDVVRDLNETERERGAHLETFRWEKDVVPEIGARPQEVVDKQTPQYDVYVGILSSRFGTPTGEYGSGTEKEFEDALASFEESGAPRILFYFNDSPKLSRTKEEAMELAKVREFRERLEKLGIVGQYSGLRGTDDAFYDRVQKHLRKVLREILEHSGGSLSGAALSAPSLPLAEEPFGALSPAEKAVAQLLLQETDQADASRRALVPAAIRDRLGLDARDINDAIANLEAHALVEARRPCGTDPYDFASVEPTHHLFAVFREVLDDDPEDDALVVVRIVDSHDGVEYADLSEKAKLPSDRLKRAILLLEDSGAVRADRSANSPIGIGRLGRTSSTRRFAEELGRRSSRFRQREEQMSCEPRSVPSSPGFADSPERRLALGVHRAYFSGSPTEYYFINATNCSASRVLEVTHIWYEDETHHISVLQKGRSLPVRLDLDQSWETWIEVGALPAQHRAAAFRHFRARISTGDVFISEKRVDVPPVGEIPG